MKKGCFISFVNTEGLPGADKEIREVMQSENIRKIVHFALGPKGTNIGQASAKWSREMGVEHKTETIFCETPEVALAEAKKVKEDGVLALFWTCAVYYKLNELFFSNPDTLPFFINYVMNLDSMQVAIRPEQSAQLIDGSLPSSWIIASHPSPAPLMQRHGYNIHFTTSNSQAAQLCAAGKTDACITTESARNSNGLKMVRKFGSPPMVFFGGITEFGANMLAGAFAQLQEGKPVAAG